MRIATFNINNANKRLENLLAWLADERPGVVCLRELKADERAFPSRPSRHPATAPSGAGNARGNGVAILAAARRRCSRGGAACG
jgi:exodeoxyribonuclease-3